MMESSTNNPSNFKRRLRRVTFFSAKFFAAIIFLIFILILWIYTGPRSIPFLSGYITNYAKELLPQTTTLYIDDVQIAIDDLNVTLRVVHPKLVDTVKGDFELTHVDLKLDLIGLFPQSNRNLLNIEISEPKLQLYKLLANSNDPNSESIKISTINEYLKLHKDKIAKLSLSLSKTSLSLNVSDDHVVDVLVNDLIISPSVKRDDVIINVFGDLSIGGKTNSLEAIIDTKSDDHLSISGTVSNISSTLLETLGYPIPELENSHVEADVSFVTALKGFRNIESIKFEITNFDGKIKKNHFFPTDIVPTNVTIKGEVLDNFKTVTIDYLRVTDQNLQLNSKLKITHNNGATRLSGTATIDNLKVNKIQDYWPTPVIARTRDWIFEHISEGTVKSASAKFNINLNEFATNKSLKKGDLEVNIDLSGSSIFYMNNVPKIRDIDGSIYINPDEITFDISKGKILESKITSAKGKIPNLGTSKSKVTVDTTVAGSLQNLIDIGFSHAEMKNDKFKNLKGEAVAKVTVSLPLDDRDLTLDTIALDVEAKAKNVSAKNIYKDYSISGGNFTAKFKDMVANISGSATANESQPVELMHYINLQNKNQVTKVKAKLNWDNLDKFKISKPEYFGNSFDATLEIQETNGQTRELIDLDLTNSTVAIDKLGIYKKIGEPGRIRVHLDKKDWGYDIDEYYVQIHDFESTGTSKISADYSSILAVDSSKTTFGKGTFALKYDRKQDADLIQIIGDSFDYESINPAKLRGGESTSDLSSNKQKEQRGLSLNVKINKLFMKNDVVLYSPFINVVCTKDKCQTIVLRGTTDKGTPINLEYQYPNLVMNSDDAASVLSGFGITDKMIGGKMYMSGKMSADMKFSGDFVITDFALRKAPILAKILSLASITMTSFEGVESLLGNKGVKFSKASCPFVYSYGVITLDDCVAKGSTIAIVAKGDVNFNTNKINLAGTAIPENIINTAVKNIPVINEIFGSKNKEDEVFGISFKVVGPADDPEVKANPLSLLTPGFLRKVFDNVPLPKTKVDQPQQKPTQ